MMRKDKGVKDSGSEAVMISNGDDSEKDPKLKGKLCYGGGSAGGGGGRSVGVMMEDVDDLLSSWPPRHYTCSFCRRRFKSAQALGGHMNVHRRARAMLRSQSSNSPISSPPSSPWLTSTITTTAAQAHHHHHHPLQDDEHQYHFIYPNPNPNPHFPSNIPHHIIPNNSNFPHLPIINISPSWALTNFKRKNPLSAEAACKHIPEGRYQHAECNAREKEKKYCLRADYKLNQDDAVVRQSLGSTGLITSRSPIEEGIDLELRLGS